MVVRSLLDTNAYSALKRGDAAVAGHLRDSKRVFFSSVVAGELLFGFLNGSRFERNHRELRSFLEDPRVRFLPVTWVTAGYFGRISTALRRRGTSIPSNDIWIAAHAMEVDANLISSDPHFGRVDGLSWIKF